MPDLPPALKRWSLAITGVVLAAVPAVRLAITTSPATTVLEGFVPLLLLGGVTYAGWTYARRESETFTAVVTAWTLAVVAGMIVVALWIRTLSHLRAADLSLGTLLPVAVSVGAFAGFWIGRNNARWRERDADLRRERQRSDFLNELLRHYVLNAAQVIIGHADRLATRTGDDDAEAISRAGQRMARQVQQMRALVADEGDCWPVDLATAVGTARDVVAERPDVRIVTDVPDPCPVLADDALDVLIEGLLVQAVERAEDGVTIRLSATRDGDGVTVTAEDDAPGPVAEAVDPEAIDTDHGVFRFQQYVVVTLAERYGGTVTVTDTGGGARIEVRLPAPAEANDAFGNA
ncbi:MAG: sensor histidine kinase [Haloplanus sp.]